MNFIRSVCPVRLNNIPSNLQGDNLNKIIDGAKQKRRTFFCIPLPRTWFSRKFKIFNEKSGKWLKNEAITALFKKVISRKYGLNSGFDGIKSRLWKRDKKATWSASEVRELFNFAKSRGHVNSVKATVPNFVASPRLRLQPILENEETFFSSSGSNETLSREKKVIAHLDIILGNVNSGKTNRLTFDRKNGADFINETPQFRFTNAEKEIIRNHIRENKKIDNKEGGSSDPAEAEKMLLQLNKIIRKTKNKKDCSEHVEELKCLIDRNPKHLMNV